MGESRVDLLGGVDVAVRHPTAKRLGRHVDELDLVRSANDAVGDGLSLCDAGDPFHDVVERLEMLDVHGRDHVDPGRHQLLDVLPPLLVAAAGDVGVRELVDEHDLGHAREHRVDIHLVEDGFAVGHLLARDDLEVADRGFGDGSPVGLDEPHDHVGAALAAAAPLVEHRHCLADARGSAYVDPQLAARHAERSAVTPGPEPRSARGR